MDKIYLVLYALVIATIGIAAYCYFDNKNDAELAEQDEMKAILATASYYKDKDLSKSYVKAFEAVRRNPNREGPTLRHRNIERVKREERNKI